MSLSSVVDEIVRLNTIANNTNCYMSSILLTLGLVSCTMILLIFTRRELRRSPNTIYILAKAICDLITLLFVVSTRAYSGCIDIDATRTNDIWCRFRTSLLYFTTFGSFTYIYLTGFDQWASTSRAVRIRTWSSRKVACRAVLVVVLVAFLSAGIPIYIMVAPVGTPAVCTYITLSYADYYSYFFFPIVYGFLPVVIPTIFGILTYLNIHSLVRRISRLEQQLTRMLLLQLIALAITSIPYTALTFYLAATRRWTKSSLRLAQENVYATLIRNFFQVNYVYSFYIFLFASSEIQNILKKVILRFIHCNQVTPNTGISANRQNLPSVQRTTSRAIRRIPAIM
jgi:hypothetical protein